MIKVMNQERKEKGMMSLRKWRRKQVDENRKEFEDNNLMMIMMKMIEFKFI